MSSFLDKSMVLDRIKEYYGLNKKVELASFLGIAPTTLSSWYSRNMIDFDIIYAKCVDVDLNWLFDRNISDGNKSNKKDFNPTVNYDYIGSPYYNVDFIGGFDLLLNDQTVNPDFYINYPPYNKEGVVWVNLTGHSMEPELSNGDIIALKPMNTPIEYLPTGEIYAIITEEYRTVKRVRLSDRSGYVRLIPSNSSFQEQEIPIEMITKVYAVLGSIRKFF